MRQVWMLLVGIIIGIVLMAVFGLGFLTPDPVDELDVYCRGAVDLFLLSQGADPLDPAIPLDVLDAGCRDQVLSGEFKGRVAG